MKHVRTEDLRPWRKPTPVRRSGTRRAGPCPRVDLKTDRGPAIAIERGNQGLPECVEMFRIVGTWLTQRVLRQSIGQRLGVAALVQPQTPAGLIFTGILTPQGTQDNRAGMVVLQTSNDPAGEGLFGIAERIGEPFGCFGCAVGEGWFGADPDVEAAGRHCRIMGADGCIKTAVLGSHARRV